MSLVSRTVRAAGFTLIELMVVLFLIGLIASFAVISMRSDPWDGQIKRQLWQLTALVSAGKEQAVLRSEEFSILFDEDGYSFQRQSDKGWEAIEDDPLFRQRKLPRGVTLKLEIEDKELRLNEDDTQQAIVLLLSSGEITPFAVTMVVAEAGLTVRQSWDAFGDVESDSDEE